MKTRTIFTVLLLLISIYSFAQDKVYTEYYDSGKLKISGFTKSGMVQTGEWKKYYENGELNIIQYFKNGNVEGESKGYYDDGKLKVVSNFKNGILEGKVTSYYKSGQIRYIGYMRDNLPSASYKFYSENGKEDVRISTLEALFKKYLTNTKDKTINKIISSFCRTYIYYTEAENDDEKLIILNHNIEELDNEGYLHYDDEQVEYRYKRYIVWRHDDRLNHFSDFKIKKQGRNEIEKIMKDLAKDCNQDKEKLTY